MKLDWETTAAQMTAALAPTSGTAAADAEVGRQILMRLQSQGGSYDLLWNAFSPQVDVDKVASEAALAAALAAWLPVYRTRFDAIDSVARWAEGVQVAANVPVSFMQYVTTVDGARYPLAPTVAIPPGAGDSTPPAAAQRVLGTLRLIAKERGAFGNTIRVEISDAAVGPEFFRLTVSRDGYSEAQEPMRPGSLIQPSLLVAQVEWSASPSRPGNTASVVLGGGAGSEAAALLARVSAALKLPALTQPQREMVRGYLPQAATVADDRPLLHPQGKYGQNTFNRRRMQSVYEHEQVLSPVVDEARAWLDAL